jgi:O-antigen/teichoic acid export membrane protein
VIINSFLIPMARPLIFAGFLVIGVTAKLAIIAYAAPTVAGFAVAAIVLASRIRHTAADPDEHVTSYRAISGEFWRFSVPRTFGATFAILAASLDVLLVGAFLSARQAAAYSVAIRYMAYGMFALPAIVQSVLPQMSRLMDTRDYETVNTVYKSSTWWTMAASWPPMIVLAIFAPLFLSLFGRGYVIAASALTILALAMLPNAGSGPNSAILDMAGRSGVNLGLLVISLTINVGLNVWLIPRIGLPGAAIALLASTTFLTILTSTILWRNFRLEPFGTGYWIVGGAALGCYGVLGLAVRFALGTGATTFAVFAVVSSCLYVAVLYRSREALNLDAFESLYSRFQLHGQHLPSKKGSKQPTS